MPFETSPQQPRRCAIYARYSTDLQSSASIEDQVRVCRGIAQRGGLEVVEIYSDYAISGSSAHRPGFDKLRSDAAAGRFEVVVAEALDRLSRDQEHIAGLYKQLSYLSIDLVTAAEGAIDELHVGLKGTMNALFLKDLAKKTHRGLEGRVRKGKSGGGRSYGYDLVPGQTGDLRIDDAEAAVVRRVFQAFAAGRSPRTIARELNDAGVPGPRGRPWGDSTIRGHIIRGTGILNNELYVGRRVWNRLRYVKDPATGRRKSRSNAAGQHLVADVPELRIVDDDLWDRVKVRQHGIRTSEGVAKARSTRFWERRRARHLLTGLVHCGACGGPLAAVGRDYLGCSTARRTSTCDNRRNIRRGPLEALILDALHSRLMAPELVEAFVAAFEEELARRRRDVTAERTIRQRQLAEVERKLDGLIEALAEGFRTPGLRQRLEELEDSKAALTAALAAEPVAPVQLRPDLALVYRAKVTALDAALEDPGLRPEAVEVLRGLIERVVVHQTDGGLEVELFGAIVPMVELALGDGKKAALGEEAACSVKVVAGVGFEPTTFRL